MNVIHQISLKLQLGIHPAVDIQPEILRAMWRELTNEKYKALKANPGKREFTGARAAGQSLSQTG